MSNIKIILYISLFILLAYNYKFFYESYNTFHNLAFLISLGFTLLLLIILILIIFSSKYTFKPVVSYIFITSSLALYFMLEYNVIFSQNMIINIFETDLAEASDLISFKLILFLLFLGILPSIIIYNVKIKYLSFKDNLKFKSFAVLIISILLFINIFIFSKNYVVFMRENKVLREYTNPLAHIYQTVFYIKNRYFTKKIKFLDLTKDVKKVSNDKKLFIFVVGEAARWDHFGLNGYNKETTPLLKKQNNLVSFKKLYSCGTETAVSVPCMFSYLTKKDFSNKLARNSSSVADFLEKANINVVWIDNNSNSKGVADRIKYYINIKNSCKNRECRDERMLSLIDKYIDYNKTNVFFLHQMGSHGPEYYKRYDEKFKKFKPVCKTNQLQKCSQEEIANAYDNTILYTDYFLNKVINYLKNKEKDFNVAMWYMADHGESLGENGIYLHGMPYFIAPEAQKHPASIMWFGKGFEKYLKKAEKLSNKEISQDYLFSTLLKLLDVNTSLYNKKLDLFSDK